MARLSKWIRSIHAHGTHSYVVIDALDHLETEAGERLASLLLRFYDRYLTGAHDPDRRFRDYQNHVLYVADGGWGGAPRAADQWCDRLHHHLAARRWPQAAYTAGVMSHYFIDSLQPLHTDQSQRGGIIQRPLQRSVACAYDELVELWRQEPFEVVVRLAETSDWLRQAIFAGARFAHGSYGLLVEEYLLEEAGRDPRAALSETVRHRLAEILAIAIVGWARVLDRVANEADLEVPRFSLAPAAFRAIVRAPLSLMLRRLEAGAERRSVAAILDEYQRTGDVVANLPPEVRTVQLVARMRAEQRQQAGPSRAGTPVRQTERPDVGNRGWGNLAAGDADAQASRPLLVRQAPIGQSPSIDAKTARRLSAIGVKRVGDLLDAAPPALAASLRTTWIRTETIRDWQDQARLMCEVPGLVARDVQLLVGAGCRTPQRLAAAHLETLCQSVYSYSDSAAGRRTLAGAKAPEVNQIRRWIAAASAERWVA